MGSSSKKKSSKKRSSKVSSQRMKKQKMKKSWKSKSKKVGRCYDSSDKSASSLSISSCSDDSYSSKSADGSVSSSSEESYRSRKKVSHLRRNTKSKRKRDRRRSPSTETSEDLSGTKKRKRPRKYADSKSRNKSRKKKPRRDMSVSSASSDSYSCSTCNGGDSSEESDLERLNSRSTEKKKDKRVSRKERIETKRRSNRSPSCSSYSRFRDQSCSVSQADEKFMGQTRSNRLRSVITVADRFDEKEENAFEKDSLKEEFFYDHDDYPSRSNDSSGGGNQRDLTSDSPLVSDKRQENIIKGEERVAWKYELTESPERRKDFHDQNVHDPYLDIVDTNNSLGDLRTGGPLSAADFSSDNLEVTLRQKALENLRKFRGGLRTSLKTATGQQNKDDGNVNRSPPAGPELHKRELHKQDNTEVIGSVQLLDRNTKGNSKGEISCFKKAVQDISSEGHTGSKSRSVELNRIHPPEELALSGNPLTEDNTKSIMVVNSEFSNSSLREQSTSTNSKLNQTLLRQASPDKNVTENKEKGGEVLPRSSPKTMQSISPSVTDNQVKGDYDNSSPATAMLGASVQSTSGGDSSNDHQDEAKDGSQFEQKTMSVMRGGEMVQVSYKVYIPKKAPALSRRQLKR